VPTCLHLCIMPLLMCPGFWIGDVIGPCQLISVPPMCTQAFFWNLWRLPPQYKSFDEANPFPKDCPSSDVHNDGLDGADDSTLYDLPQSQSSPMMAASELSPAVTGVRKDLIGT